MEQKAKYKAYQEVAARVLQQQDCQRLLKQLLDKQPEAPKTATEVSPPSWVCVVTSSGTGKTQLAVTAGRWASSPQTKVKVVYLFGGVLGEHPQPFYTLHTSLGQKLLEAFSDGPFKDKKYQQPVSPWSLPQSAPCVAYGLLRTVLCSEQVLNVEVKPCTLEELREAVLVVRQQGRRLLVFVDEVPEQKRPGFVPCMLLRSTLRWIGVCPVLMSTDSGAMDAVQTSARGASDALVCCIEKLPQRMSFVGRRIPAREQHSPEQENRPENSSSHKRHQTRQRCHNTCGRKTRRLK